MFNITAFYTIHFNVDLLSILSTVDGGPNLKILSESELEELTLKEANRGKLTCARYSKLKYVHQPVNLKEFIM